MQKVLKLFKPQAIMWQLQQQFGRKVKVTIKSPTLAKQQPQNPAPSENQKHTQSAEEAQSSLKSQIYQNLDASYQRSYQEQINRKQGQADEASKQAVPQSSVQATNPNFQAANKLFGLKPIQADALEQKPSSTED